MRNPNDWHGWPDEPGRRQAMKSKFDWDLFWTVLVALVITTTVMVLVGSADSLDQIVFGR